MQINLLFLQPKVRLGVREGEKYKVKDLLYGLMLESYNDCAVVLAEHAEGSVENFEKRMNQMAENLGTFPLLSPLILLSAASLHSLKLLPSDQDHGTMY